MAGLPWFELNVDMPDDPKCVALGVRLKNPLAFAYIVRLYAYCYRHGRDGFTGPGAPCTVEAAAGWRGRTGQLFAALLAEGFIDRGAEPETFAVHGVSARLGPHLAKLERDRKRARERRDEAAKEIGRGGDVARTSRERAGDVHGDRDRDTDTSPPTEESTPRAVPGSLLPGIKVEPKAKPEKPSDPRHYPVRQMLVRVFAEFRQGAELRFGALEARKLRDLLDGTRADPAEFERRWREALTARRGRRPCSSVLDFCARWDEFAAVALDGGGAMTPAEHAQFGKESGYVPVR